MPQGKIKNPDIDVAQRGAIHIGLHIGHPGLQSPWIAVENFSDDHPRVNAGSIEVIHQVSDKGRIKMFDGIHSEAADVDIVPQPFRPVVQLVPGIGNGLIVVVKKPQPVPISGQAGSRGIAAVGFEIFKIHSSLAAGQSGKIGIGLIFQLAGHITTGASVPDAVDPVIAVIAVGIGEVNDQFIAGGIKVTGTESEFEFIHRTTQGVYVGIHRSSQFQGVEGFSAIATAIGLRFRQGGLALVSHQRGFHKNGVGFIVKATALALGADLEIIIPCTVPAAAAQRQPASKAIGRKGIFRSIVMDGDVILHWTIDFRSAPVAVIVHHIGYCVDAIGG